MDLKHISILNSGLLSHRYTNFMESWQAGIAIF